MTARTAQETAEMVKISKIQCGRNLQMSIDDPIDAAESAVASDERTDAPLAKYAPDLAEVAQALPVEFLPPGLSHAALAVKTLLPESGAFDSL